MKFDTTLVISIQLCMSLIGKGLVEIGVNIKTSRGLSSGQTMHYTSNMMAGGYKDLINLSDICQQPAHCSAN